MKLVAITNNISINPEVVAAIINRPAHDLDRVTVELINGKAHVFEGKGMHLKIRKMVGVLEE